MLKEMFDSVIHGQNQFASGGLLLMVIGAVGAFLRGVPKHIWDFTLRQTTLTFTMTDDNASFRWFKHWYHEQQAAKSVRRVDVSTYWRDHTESNVLLSPAPGVHWMWRGRKPMRITLTRSDDKKFSNERSETFTVQVFGRNNQFIQEIVKEMIVAHDEQMKDTATLSVWQRNEWTKVIGYRPRKLETVVLPKTVKDTLVTDIDNFLASESWYRDRGIPYRRCYLFYGIPGSGKTSLINALADQFNLSTCLLRPSEVTDSEFSEAVTQAGPKSVVLLEDIDGAGASASRMSEDIDISDAPGSTVDMKLKPSLTLSGLLNTLDGIATPNGALFFMTTNHIEKLDPALLRAGRCDVKVLFANIQDAEKITMYQRFLGGSDDDARRFIAEHPATSASEFQESLLQQHAQERNIEYATA